MTEQSQTPPHDAGPVSEHGREIGFAWSLVPVVSLIALLWLVIVELPRGLDWAALTKVMVDAGVKPSSLPSMPAKFEGSGHLPLVLAAAIAAIVARFHGWRWRAMQAGMQHTINLAMGAVLILLIIGALMGTWMASGIVPALISWGLVLMEPSFFLPATCAVCSVISLVSGSSWSTAGTIGVALIGVAQAMGIDVAITAGAIISGAYFGDKLSPMSDTTNLAPAMAGSDLFVHIRHMVWTTGPSWVIAMIAFTFIGLNIEPTETATSVAVIQDLIRAEFRPGLIHAAVPILVIGLVVRRMPALPTLALGAACGGALAMIHGQTFGDVLTVAMSGYTSETGNSAVDDLLSRGGISGMLNTVLLILCAMVFGGVMECTGMLRVLAAKILARAQSTGSLIASTILTSIGSNILAADQYIAVVVPGRMYAAEYERRGLAPENLSRALEDGGTITSVLVPWNTCGAFMSATLGVATGSYFWYCFLNLVNPLIGMLYGYTGWTIRSLKGHPPSEDSSSEGA